MGVRAPFFAAKIAFRAPFSVLASWQTSQIHIQNQEILVRVLGVDRRSFAYIEAIDRRSLWLDGGSSAMIQGVCNSRWFGKALETPSSGPGGIRSNAGIDLGDGVAATQKAHQASEQFVRGGIRQVFLR
jgi:hypothetical protein